ncbi:gamma carbonic anhydrase family protein [Archaeoglobus veneficus]|uniref:Carbonate dehydratase n=1 Tax=Archaeoglobus veneficus (strain DSM 11195 / SNP6) TaxID=693661 RepID=F2KNT3_ARCVS|nr:carbonic anhydrase [Archaeoglobus veneficus]AEA47410.1 Carbonate dehydratase [Archaeoglobus veneficus SNP6]
MRWAIILTTVLFAALLLGCAAEKGAIEPLETPEEKASNIHANPITEWNDEQTMPDIDPTAFVHPYATVIGDVHIGKYVCISPHASVRGDEGMPIYVGDYSNIQDCVVIHALETRDAEGNPIEKNLVVGDDGKKYAVYIADHVSLAHQSQVHGPAYVGSGTFIGMQALVFKAKVGKNCVIEPGAKVIGVTIPDGRYVPAGMAVTNQSVADNLPEITEDYPFKHTNEAVVHVNIELAKGYNAMFGGESTEGTEGEGGH